MFNFTTVKFNIQTSTTEKTANQFVEVFLKQWCCALDGIKRIDVWYPGVVKDFFYNNHDERQ